MLRPDNLSRPFTRGLLASGVLVVAIVAALAGPGAVYGATFTVNTTNDVDDGTCNVTHCSLREALNAANTLGGPDIIAFNVGGGGVQTIAPTSGLPGIASPMTIDATTQPGYAGTPLIEITGTTGASYGFAMSSTGVILRGLSITDFSGDAIVANAPGSGGSKIEGNYLGLRPDGSVLGNGGGVYTTTSGHTIGGTTADKRNVVAGNNTNIEIAASTADGNVVQGNFVGTDPTGMIAINSSLGIIVRVGATNTTIGGVAPGARNVVAGQTYGVEAAGVTGTIIEGNYLGVNAAGTATLANEVGASVLSTTSDSNVIRNNVIAGNTRYGVENAGTNTLIEGNRIGVGPDGVTPMGNGDGTSGDAGIYVSDGDTDILQNTIAYSAGRGIRAETAASPTIRGNRIFLNDALGIDIDDDNVADAPCCMTITSATTNPGVTLISGNVTAPPNTVWVLDFYDSGACDGSGFGEGEHYLGMHVVPMGAASFVSFSFPTSAGVTPGRVVTGTVNAASEFSSCVTVPACGGSDSDCDAWLSPQATKHIGPTNTDTATDNCASVWNTPQGNTDGNFIDSSPPYAVAVDDKTWPRSDAQGNDCDPDDDNDGLDDGVEIGLPYAPCPTASGPTNPLLRDTDGDRVLDGAECALGFDPLSSASKPTLTQCAPAGDSDGDKISNRNEFCYYGSSTASADSDGDAPGGLDGDGGTDGCEVASINADQVVNSGDQGKLASGISGATPYHAGVDINKDGLLNSGDQGLMASFISPPGQCPG